MKKTLSLLLAALMCATMTPAVMAEEVAEVPAIEVTAEAVVEEVVVNEETLISLTASLNVTIPAEMIEALLTAVTAPTVESIKNGALVFGVELTDEAADAILAFLLAHVADIPANMADTDVIGEAEAVTEIAVVEETIPEEAAEEVVEEAHKYPPIFEEIPTFGLFSKILSKFTFRG